MTACTSNSNDSINPPINNNNTISNDVPTNFSNDCDILKSIYTSLNLSAIWKNKSMKCCNDDTIICSTVDDVLRITKMYKLIYII